MILFYIWVLGCFINIYLLYKDNYEIHEAQTYLNFDFRVNIILDIIKCCFIFSSFIGTIFYIIMKLRDKHNENI